jgi:hypothetical protein
VEDIVADSLIVGGYRLSVVYVERAVYEHTRVFRLVQDPMVLAEADLVLVAAFSNITKLFAEDEVVGSRLVLLHVHLKCRPSAEGRGDIDGWLHARLREGNGRLGGHGVAGEYVGQQWEDRKRGYAADYRHRVGRVPGG